MRHKATAEADPRHAADNVEPFIGGPSRSVGERLRNAREDLGLELRQVSETLRIRYAHLRALEEGDLRELPGQTYAVGFVRTYADYLGLDSREMVERYKEEMSGIPRSTQLVFPTPKPEGKIPGGALVLISLLLVGLAYGGWYAFNEYGDELESLIMREAPPASVAERPEAPASAPAAPATAPSAAPESRVEPAPEAAAPEAPATGLPAAEAPAPEAPAAEAPSAEAPAVPETAQPAAPAPAATAPAATAPAAPAATPAATAETPTTEAPRSEAPRTETPAAPAQSEPAATAEATPQGGDLPPAEEAPAAQTQAESAREVEAPAASLPAVTGGTAPATERQAPALAEAPADEAVRDVGPQPAAEPTAEPAPQPTAEPAPQAAREPAPQTTVAREEEIPVPPIPGSAGGSQSARAGRVFGTANTDARIVLRATADSWVQVRNARSDLLFTQVLRAGDSYNVPNEPGLTLLTGNAGGLQVLVDGQPAPSLGPEGAVRRDVELEPQSLLQGAR